MSAYIPLEIQAEIIKRLPIKPLIQFQTVSKEWKSLIDSSQFIAEYQQNSQLQQHLLVRKDISEHDYVSFVHNDTFPHQKVSITLPKSIPNRIVGCSQGLFCFYDFHNAAVIWNPTLRKYVDVVVPGRFDGRFINDNIGFAVCPRTLDPLLVKIPTEDNFTIENSKNTTWVVEVFSLSLGVWKSLCMDLPGWYIEQRCNHVVIDKFIYWHALERMGGCNMIVPFDMISEEFTEIYLPDDNYLSGGEDVTGMFISKLKESLVVIQVNKGGFCVWMMDNGEPKSFKHIYTTTCSVPGPLIRYVNEFNRNGEVIVDMNKELDKEKEHELFVYEPIS